jgi:hypothetical protein
MRQANQRAHATMIGQILTSLFGLPEKYAPNLAPTDSKTLSAQLYNLPRKIANALVPQYQIQGSFVLSPATLFRARFLVEA